MELCHKCRKRETCEQLKDKKIIHDDNGEPLVIFGCNAFAEENKPDAEEVLEAFKNAGGERS